MLSNLDLSFCYFKKLIVQQFFRALTALSTLATNAVLFIELAHGCRTFLDRRFDFSV